MINFGRVACWSNLTDYIVKSDDSLTIDELKAFSHEQLTGYKRPRQYTFIEQLPKTGVGKIQKTELRLLEKNSK